MAGSDSHIQHGRSHRAIGPCSLLGLRSLDATQPCHACSHIPSLAEIPHSWSVHAGDTQCSMISPITLSTRGVLLLSVAIVLAAAVMVTTAQPEAPLFVNAKETKVTGGNLLVFSPDRAELKVKLANSARPALLILTRSASN